MKRFLKLYAVVAMTTLFTACKQDDGNAPAPPRDYGVQYAAEKVAIEDFLKNYYIKSVDADFNVEIDSIRAGNPEGHVSIWDQTTYPLQFKEVRSNNVDYKVYYLKFNQGAGEMPTRGDAVFAAYKGVTLNSSLTVFEQNPFPQDYLFLTEAIEGWREIMPLFNAGIYNNTNPENPASFSDYGAGVMFLPSGLAYYNRAVPNIGTYVPMIFSFKLYDVQYLDSDGDGIYNKDEKGTFEDVADYDSDGDGKPNYLDTDDDNDGYLTKTEIGYVSGTPLNYANIKDCSGVTTTGTKKHLDPACH